MTYGAMKLIIKSKRNNKTKLNKCVNKLCSEATIVWQVLCYTA